MDSKFKNFLFVTMATALLFSTCDSFRTVKLGGKDCTFKGEKVGKKISCYPAKAQLDVIEKKTFLTLMLSTQQKIKGTPQVCNGAVVKEIGKSLVKICTDGKIKLKPRKQVPVVFLLHSYPARLPFLLLCAPRGGGSFKYFTTNIDILAIF